MADLELKCPTCSRVTTVSEFVSDEALTCRGCGATLPRPQRADAKPKPRMRLHGLAQAEEPGKDADAMTLSDASHIWPGRYRRRSAGRAKIRHHLYAWLVFFVLGALMAYLRYGGGLPPQHLDILKRYAAFGLVGCHLLIILKAFEDSVFQGILCLLVPFYTLYYAFAVTDAVYLRALVGAVLIGIGQDGVTVLQDHFFRIAETIRAWIARGG